MKKCIAANWKMYKTPAESIRSAYEIFARLESNKIGNKRQIIIFPPFTSIYPLAQIFSGSKISLGAQNCFLTEMGAYTGEISPKMLVSSGCSYVLLGHSERRRIFEENNEFIRKKILCALNGGLKVILCIGETLQEREKGMIDEVLKKQMFECLNDIPLNFPSDLTLAYEPIWAIGTGRVAGEKETYESHSFIRNILRDLYPDFFENIRILYGGSVKPENAKWLLGIKNVDGLLVGGASLEIETFIKIISA